MRELKIACQNCRGHIEFPENIHGEMILCPHCGLSLVLTVPGYQDKQAKVQSAAPQIKTGKIKSGRKTSAGGLIIEIIGLSLCLTVVGAIIGIPLIILGGRMSVVKKCSCCGNEIFDKGVKICPSCSAHF